MSALRHLVSLIFLLLMGSQSLGQSILSGKLTDRQTGEPVPFASVYFANTTLGSSSLDDGTFSINRIPAGKYDLLVEMIGYRRHRQAIVFNDLTYHLDISLVQDTVQLSPVSILATSDKRYLPVFIRFFVGDDWRAKDCSILNPEVLHLYYDTARHYLSAIAREPVEVLNPVLGYKVVYSLDRFGLDFSSGSKHVEGIPRFAELVSQRKKDSTNWVNKRSVAYKGSLLHFMRSLYHGTVDAEGFNVFIVEHLSSDSAPEEVLRPFSVKDLITGDKVRQLNFQGILKVEYREPEARDYPGRFLSGLRGRNPHGFQQTYISLANPSLQIYENGYYAEQVSVFLNGYLAWRETISSMVPLGFVPVKKKLKL